MSDAFPEADAVVPRELYEQAVTEAEQLREALLSRAVIDQAKGILMAQHRCDADSAFAILVRRSQDENVKLRTVATSLVRSVRDPVEDRDDDEDLEPSPR
ncbi:ANTAR domain-containing protein [Angustibacter peucedani]